MRALLLTAFILLFFLKLPILTLAVEDPLAVANNKFGMHIISPSYEEASESAQLVNSNGGDWGYITFVIESSDRKVDKWQQFFNTLRKKHLIPIVRIATKPAGSVWEKPTDQDALEWANFLNELNWPVKNRYVVIYNEPNHASEWGGNVEPESYARVLDQTITALKQKSEDFFVLNAGFDASTPHEPPNYYDERRYLTVMEETVPGIFNRLDGWSSHSYPNPGFVGSPNGNGRGTVRTYKWELAMLKSLGLNKPLPVFITETGWKHSEGISLNRSLPSPEKVAEYYKTAFENAWNSPEVVAVTPFLLNYPQPPFDHFSFKKVSADPEGNVLGESFPDFHEHYISLVDLPKTNGSPKQKNEAQFIEGEFYQSIAINQEYTLPLTFKNTGGSIWNDKTQIKLAAISGGEELNFFEVSLPEGKTVEPNQEHTFDVKIKATQGGTKTLVLNLLANGEQFQSPSIQLTTEAKAPVSLIIKAALQWKDDAAGEYTLTIDETINKGSRQITLGEDGSSPEIQTYELLPDYDFTLTLNKPYYKPKTIKTKVSSGVNTIDFGQLEPDIFSIIFNPKAWFSN